MEVINSADFFGANIEVREENFKSLLKKETEEKYLGNYYESMYFFKGAIYGLLFCLPFWTILIWLISWLLISVHLFTLAELERSNWFLFSSNQIFLTFTFNYQKLKTYNKNETSDILPEDQISLNLDTLTYKNRSCQNYRYLATT